MSLLQVSALSKHYGAFTALDNVSFTISSGEIVGFLGPNGAGKTTTMKILTGFMAPTSGTAQIAGFDVVTDSLEVRRRIGYLPEAAPTYQEMQVRDYLDFIGQIRSMASSERARAIERVAQECDLEDRLKQVIGTLSKGYRQRVGLAQALLHQPALLILDEPTSGLDPNQILSIRNLIRKIGQSRTVILSTHILQEVEATCDRVLILSKGKLVADAPTGQVRLQGEGSLAKVGYIPGSIRLPKAKIQALIAAIPGVQRVEAQEEASLDRFEVLATRDVRPELFKLAVDSGLVMVEISRESSSLEEVFRRLTLHTDHEQHASHQQDGDQSRSPNQDQGPTSP
jgi:ABC-2 type transport system ATP-binding protein